MICGDNEVRKARAAVIALAALACALIAPAAVPAFASADFYVVNSNGDAANEVPGKTCDTGAPTGEQCTLRAAIESADFEAGFDNIELAGGLNGPFSCVLGTSEIQLREELPIVTSPVNIFSHPCDVPLENLVKPSAGVVGNPGEPTLTVQGNEVTIQDIAFGGGTVGIQVEGEEFKAQGDWFGLDLEAQAKPISAAGIALFEGSDSAVIGADEFDNSPRNVFANSDVGISLEGTSDDTIEGNYIGVGPDGTTLAGVRIGVRIANGTTAVAEDNMIGGELTQDQANSAVCDGPCNAIATDEGIAVDLAGDIGDTVQAASGPTTISGNYIGLSADGNSKLGDGGENIYAGPTAGQTVGPADVTLGGPATPGTGSNQNVIDGHRGGVYVENADGFLAEGNLFGWLPGKSESGGSGQEEDVFYVRSEGVTDRPEITQNGMHLEIDATGIESAGEGAQITFNTMEGGRIGIETKEDDGGKGNLIRANQLLGNPDVFGMLLQNDSNVVIGNTIIGAGHVGIEVNGDPPYPAHNRIGGDSSGEANRIEGSAESAINLGGLPATHNEAAGNFGAGNGGPFISLFGHESRHPPNGEITPPTLEVVEQSKVSGTAEPGAKVRVFEKASTDVGELGALIGAGTADSSGHWTATIPFKLNVGGLVAATQTTEAGTAEGATSEVSTPKAAIADKEEEGSHHEEETHSGDNGGGGNSGGGSTGTGPSTQTPPPAKAPKVTLTKKPKKTSTATKATFKFKATPPAGAKFECKLDGAKWRKCKSPTTYKKLKPRKHTFRVRATASGLTGPVTKYQFTVKA